MHGGGTAEALAVRGFETRTAWGGWARGLGAAALGLALTVGFGALVPKHLPEPQLPNLVLARPHRITPGQDVEVTQLVKRLGRLGYRRTRSSAPGPGEYFLGHDRIRVQRR